MSFFSKKRSTAGGALAGPFPADEVRDALIHLLRITARAATYHAAEPNVRLAIDRNMHQLERATLPADFETAALATLEIKLPLALSEEKKPGAWKKLLEACIDGAVPLAQAATLSDVVAVLERLRKDLGASDIDSRFGTTFTGQLARVTESVQWLRRTAEVMKTSLSEIVETLEALATDEPQTHGRLKALRDRLVQAADIEELEQLRRALIGEASSLVEEANARSVRSATTRERIRRTQQQVSVLEAALADARSMASTDPLTGLGNRRALDEHAPILAKSDKRVGVLALDIDHFKKVNDTYGHAVGDVVLRHVADTLFGELRGDDRAFRVGGEEFLVLLSDAPVEGAQRTAERLRDRVAREPVTVQNQEIPVTISIGVTEWKRGARLDDASKVADEALYSAKQTGRNKVVVKK